MCQLSKNTSNKNANVRKTKQNRVMLLSNCAICGKKKIFIKNQELDNFSNISNEWLD